MIPKKRPVQYSVEVEDLDDEEEDSDVSDELPEKETAVEKSNTLESEDEDDNEDEEEDDEEDEDDEEEEEEEEEDGETSKKSKQPKKKRKKNLYIEEEAEVDEDDDEEEFDEYEEDDFINEADDATKLEPQIYREIDQRREARDFEDAEDITRRLKERYGRGAYGEPSAYMSDVTELPMQFLLPSAKDPNLWLVRCKPGKERDIVQNLMRKYVDFLETDHPLRIKSVIARDNLKGYIYVEARSQADVQHALDRVNNVYVSKITLVPAEEMVDVLTVKKKGVELKAGDWVRIKRGKYKGDLAQVTAADNSDVVEVKFIPRLDMASKLSKDKDRKRRVSVRPPQRLFNERDVPRDNRDLGRSGSFWVWGNDRFDRNGFMVKEINLTGLEADNIQPTLEEIAKFSLNEEEQSFNLANLALQSKDANKSTNKGVSVERFALGDSVIVTEGDLINASGTVKSIGKNHVVIHMKNEGLGDVEVEKSKLSRLFQVGDHVRVVRGKHENDTGMITQVKGQILTVFSDTNFTQFECLTKDVRTSAEVSTTENKHDVTYSVQDLVQLGTTGVGVVIKVDRGDQYKILDQNGVVQTVNVAEITQKRDSRRAVALDINQATLHSGDIVDILYGEYANKQATVLHLYRTWAFLACKDVNENNGIVVVRTKMIRISGNLPRVAITPINPPGTFKMPTTTPQRRKDLIGKTVYITKGSFKGYQGFVKDITEKGARVQLNTNAKMLTINPLDLRLKSERVIGRDAVDNSRAPSSINNNSAVYGARTPAVFNGAQTPAHHEGAKTPAWDAGARTPAWDAGARTPGNFGHGSDVGSLDNWHNYQSPYTSTPGALLSTPMAPGTPGAPTPSATSIAAGSSARSEQQKRDFGDDWLVKDLEVRFMSGDFENKTGYVVDVSDGGRSGAVVVENARVELASDHLEPVAPNKKDLCLFLGGEYKGQKGSLIGMDGNDAIVKLDATGDFKIVSMGIVCKIHSL